MVGNICDQIPPSFFGQISQFKEKKQKKKKMCIVLGYLVLCAQQAKNKNSSFWWDKGRQKIGTWMIKYKNI